MNKKISLLFVFFIALGFIGCAFAHTSEVIGNYKLETGWKNEPPVVGLTNEIELIVTTATAFDKSEAAKMDESMAGMDMSGMAGMDHSGVAGMDMSISSKDNYDVKIGPVLEQFESGKMTATMAITQISDMITKENPTDDFGEELKYLIDDVYKGLITNDDALYRMIEIIGFDTSSSTEMDHSNMSAMQTSSEHSMGPIISTGLLKGSTVDVMLGDNDVSLDMTEDSKYPGVYHGEFTPIQTGFPMVHISGNLDGKDLDITFHPEQVEALSALRPLQQAAMGIEPGDVQCKEGYILYMRTYDDTSSVCLHPNSGEKLMKMGIVVPF